MTQQDIATYDPGGMYSLLVKFPEQVEDAVRIGAEARLNLSARGVKAIVLTGLGGSAIGGDLARSYLAGELSIPFHVNRHYTLPRFVDKNSLVVVSSYSGNTEETVAAHREAVRRKARVLCITSGGTTASLASRYGNPAIMIPAGFPPRAALGYSFFTLLIALARIGVIRRREKDIRQTIRLLRTWRVAFSDPESGENAPLSVARRLHGKLPIIYAPAEHLDAVAIRWRGQLCENSKQLAFGHVLPEMNHNELVGWKNPAEVLQKMEVVFLRDRGTHRRVAMREEITRNLLTARAGGVTEVWSEGKSLLSRMMHLVHFGDWVSFYLAILNKEDPMPVRVIDSLKEELASG